MNLEEIKKLRAKAEEKTNRMSGMSEYHYLPYVEKHYEIIDWLIAKVEELESMTCHKFPKIELPDNYYEQQEDCEDD